MTYTISEEQLREIEEVIIGIRKPHNCSCRVRMDEALSIICKVRKSGK